MNNKWLSSIGIMILVVVSLFYYQKQNGSIKSLVTGITFGNQASNPVVDQTQTSPSVKKPTYKTITFDEIGISLEVPSEMFVRKTPVYAPGTSNLQEYSFFIQNYTVSPGQSNNFQMYAIYQPKNPTVTWDELVKAKDDKETYKYALETEYNGLKAIETKVNGERGNYTYLILLRGHVLTVAVSSPSDQNKSIGDRIIGSIKETTPAQ